MFPTSQPAGRSSRPVIDPRQILKRFTKAPEGQTRQSSIAESVSGVRVRSGCDGIGLGSGRIIARFADTGGLRSPMRAQLFGDAAPRNTGCPCWRSVPALDQAPLAPDTQLRVLENEDVVIRASWWSRAPAVMGEAERPSERRGRPAPKQKSARTNCSPHGASRSPRSWRGRTVEQTPNPGRSSRHCRKRALQVLAGMGTVQWHTRSLVNGDGWYRQANVRQFLRCGDKLPTQEEVASGAPITIDGYRVF